MTISASIPTSSQVAHATNSGEPILLAQPKHQVSQAVKKLASSLTGSRSVSSTPAAANGSSHGGHAAAAPKRSLLRRNGR
jgi:pilus assembly protein CpaE